MKKYLLYCLLFLSCPTFADSYKIYTTGTLGTDTVIRKILGDKAAILAQPGADGILLYHAFDKDNSNSSFALVPTQSLHVSPFINEHYKFDPLDKYEVIMVVASYGFSLVKRKDFNYNVSTLKNLKRPIMVAGIISKGICHYVVASLSKKHDFEYVYVPYKPTNFTQAMDLATGITDISCSTDSTLRLWQSQYPEIVMMRDVSKEDGIQLYNYVLAKKGTSREAIDAFIHDFKAGSDPSIFSKGSMTPVLESNPQKIKLLLEKERKSWRNILSTNLSQ